MSIYVDAIFEWTAGYRGKDSAQAARVGTRHGHRWCHLFADEADCEELHAFAAKLGMRRSWFQGDHYDLVPPRRARAVALGAVEVDRAHAVAIRRDQRAHLAARAPVSP